MAVREDVGLQGLCTALERVDTRPVRRPMESSARSARPAAEKDGEEEEEEAADAWNCAVGALPRTRTWSASAEEAAAAAESSRSGSDGIGERFPTVEALDLSLLGTKWNEGNRPHL